MCLVLSVATERLSDTSTMPISEFETTDPTYGGGNSDGPIVNDRQLPVALYVLNE